MPGEGLAFSTVSSHNMCAKKIEITVQKLIDFKVIEKVTDIRGFTFMGKV